MEWRFVFLFLTLDEKNEKKGLTEDREKKREDKDSYGLLWMWTVNNTKRSSPAAYLFLLLLLLLLCNRRGERTDGRTENARIGNVSGHFFNDALLQTVEQTHPHKNNNGIRATGPRHRISVVIAKDGLNRGVSLSTNSREYRDDCAHVRCDASPAPFSWTARF